MLALHGFDHIANGERRKGPGDRWAPEGGGQLQRAAVPCGCLPTRAAREVFGGPTMDRCGSVEDLILALRSATGQMILWRTFWRDPGSGFGNGKGRRMVCGTPPPIIHQKTQHVRNHCTPNKESGHSAPCRRRMKGGKAKLHKECPYMRCVFLKAFDILTLREGGNQ